MYYCFSQNWLIQEIDINGAFLNGDLTKYISMAQPPCFIHGDSTLACKLNKALYGLKQAQRAWFQKLHSFLTKPSFQ